MASWRLVGLAMTAAGGFALAVLAAHGGPAHRPTGFPEAAAVGGPSSP